MKKAILAVLLVLLVGVFSGCGNSKDSVVSNEKTLKVGAALTPHTEILEFIKPKLKDKGINLEIINLDSEEGLNPALDEKQIDANYFQHLPYLESIEKEKGYDFKVVGKIHIEPIGFYSNSLNSLSELKEGAEIGIPNNPSNEFRSLKLLEDNGLIKLKDNLQGYSATPNDIVDNPHKLKFIEAEAAQLPRSLKDLSGAIINTNLIIESGLDPEKAIVREGKDSPYANIVVVRNGDENREDIKELINLLQTEEVKQFLKEKYGSAVIPAF